MVLNGRAIVDKHYITFPDDLLDNETVVQPNGVDLRLDRVWQVVGRIHLERDKKISVGDAQVNEILPKSGFFDLDDISTGNYLLDFRENISVPDGYCAIIVPRSSMLRTGIFVTSALWDTGFQGRVGASARVRNPLRVQWGSAMAQVMFHKSEFSGHRYSGGYQNTNSQTGLFKR